MKPTDPPSAETSDSLIVCFLRPKGDGIVLIPNLAAFLSLVAIAGTEAIALDASDDDYRASREQALQDDGFREASLLLCRLPGVEVPSRPSRILRECPKVDLFFEKRPPDVISLDAARRLMESGKQDSAAEVLVLLVNKFLDLGDLVPPANWQSLGELLKVAQLPLPPTSRDALSSYGVEL